MQLLNRKRQREEYENLYATMHFLVEYGVADKACYNYMKPKFEILSKYFCCNREKCQVLENNFCKKFHNFILEEYVEK
jgi:hypothetical protein